MRVVGILSLPCTLRCLIAASTQVYAGCLEAKLRQLVQETRMLLTVNSDDPGERLCLERGWGRSLHRRGGSIDIQRLLVCLPSIFPQPISEDTSTPIIRTWLGRRGWVPTSWQHSLPPPLRPASSWTQQPSRSTAQL